MTAVLSPTTERASRRGAPTVHLEGVSKRYGKGESAVVALRDFNLDVSSGEFVCLIGASGCGKTTLLNLVAGFDRASRGTVDVNGTGWSTPADGMADEAGDSSRLKSPSLPAVAMLFQDSALFPWLTVTKNVEFPLRLKGVNAADRRAVAADLLERVHLGGFGKKRPHELSGGMRQRVALARALAQDAGLLLMDEPFGALDAITRDLLHDELESLWLERRFTVLFVTHNVREAARLGDRIVLLTSRPGHVAHVYPVDLPRPRRIDSAQIATLAGRLTDDLRAEVRRHAH